MFGLLQGHLYKQVYTDETLTEAWRWVRVGTELAGIDGVTVAQFQARLFANLKALQNDIRHRRYHPQQVKRISIPKGDGTRRPPGILTVTDRIVQRAVLLVIEPLFDAGFEECSHGFRKGRSVHTALEQVVRLVNLGYGWVVDLDIASCFDCINTGLLYKCIRHQLKDAELQRLIWAWLDIATVTVTRQGVFRTRESRGILQGSTLSPLLANIYLDRFDKMALKRSLKLVRYADDCVICCRSKPEAEAALKLAEYILAELELTVNPRKTVISHAEKGLQYLGERLFLKKKGRYEEVVIAPRERVTQTHTRLLPDKFPTPRDAPAEQTSKEDTWVPSTSPSKEP